MAPRKRIGIGFVGAGGNTKLRHLPGFAAIDGVELVVVANRSRASAQQVADEFQIQQAVENWQDVVHHPDVDAVCVGTWPNMHAEVTIAALRAGKHVLTEARMARNATEAAAMLKENRQRPDLIAQIVPSPFTLPFDSLIQQRLRNGDLGEILEVSVEHTHGALCDPASPIGWRQDPEISGHNMLTLGIYHEAVQRWFGPASLEVEVAGTMLVEERRHWERGVTLPVTLPESLHVLGSLSSGAILNYRFSAIERGSARNSIRINGSKAAMSVCLSSGQLIYHPLPGESQLIGEAGDDDGWRVEQDFVSSIRDGTPVRLTSFADGRDYMQFTDAVHAAWQSSRPAR